MKHFIHPEFWKCYQRLRPEIQVAADKNFLKLKTNPNHPSLHFKKIGRYWSARININHRALAIQTGEEFIWFWVGNHQEYERLVAEQKK